MNNNSKGPILVAHNEDYSLLIIITNLQKVNCVVARVHLNIVHQAIQSVIGLFNLNDPIV